MDVIDDYAAFVAVAETLGFNAAARRMGLTTAGVSKSVKRLEERLAVRLFTRTTRRVTLTPEGQSFYAKAREIVDRIEEAERTLRDDAKGLSGPIRLAMPVLLGQQVVAPLLERFRRSHPDIVVELLLADGLANLVENGIDLTLRFGQQRDSDLVVRKLAATQFVTCAAPSYLENFGSPRSIEALADHSCVTYVVQPTGRPMPWHFQAANRRRAYTPRPRDLVHDGGANWAMGMAGVGIIQDIDVALAPSLSGGHLVEVLKSLRAEGPPLNLLMPAGRFQTRRVRALAEFLNASFSVRRARHG